jgi:hypothetical protein
MCRLRSCAPLGGLVMLACLAGPAAVAGDDAKESKLKYKVEKGPGGTWAAFDGWRAATTTAGGWFTLQTAPRGREKDFALRVSYGTPDKKDLEKLFELGPKVVEKLLPGLKRQGKPTKATFGGDEARVERWEGNSPDKVKRVARVVYLRKKDVAVAIIGLGTEAGTKELGEAVEITAKSLSFKESPLEKGLAGTWSWSTSSSVGGLTMTASKRVTITADGQFTWRNSGVGTGEVRLAAGEVRLETTGYLKDGTMKGKVIRRGPVLTFHADDGRRWSLTYRLKGNNGLELGGQLFAKE